jgi:hypothetical protein
MNQLAQVLVRRLEGKGIQESSIPFFVRSLANTFSFVPRMTRQDLNKRLHLLGWTDFELDDHTLQLVIAVLEARGLMGGEHGKSHLFETAFHLNTVDEPGSVKENPERYMPDEE